MTYVLQELLSLLLKFGTSEFVYKPFKNSI